MRRFRLVRRGGIFNPLYDEARLDSPIRRGLNWILAANVFGTIFGIICGGGTAAMVGLAGSMGAGDMEFGLLVAIPQIAALLQIPFSIVVNRTRKRKLYILTVGLISRMLWVTFGFLPLISRVPGSMLPLYTLITLLGLSSAMGAMINVCWFPWFSDLTPIRIRGRWLSLRDTILAVASLLSGLMVAWLLDILPVESKYISIFLIGGVMGMMDMICFAPVPEVWAAAPRKISIRHTFKEAMQNKPFLQLVIVWTAWCFTANLSGAYLTPYAMNSMGLNFMQITIFGTVAASVATVVAVPKWGQTLDRFGAKNVMLIGCVGASLTPAFYLLSTPGNVLPTLLHNAVGALFLPPTTCSCPPRRMKAGLRTSRCFPA